MGARRRMEGMKEEDEEDEDAEEEKEGRSTRWQSPQRA